jgi:hypothetical protein
VTRASDTRNWRPVAGYEALYAVSDDGLVKSFRKGRIMSPGSGQDGYPIVSLYKDGQRKGIAVHRLVALAFLPEGQNALHNEVAHLDGDRTNCRADNLKWVSKLENHSHRFIHGTNPAGSRHPQAKLTEDAVRDIRSRRNTSRELAAKYGVARRTVYDLWSGKGWRHVHA